MVNFIDVPKLAIPLLAFGTRADFPGVFPNRVIRRERLCDVMSPREFEMRIITDDKKALSRWTRIRCGVGSCSLACGCLAGFYETYSGHTLGVVDAKGALCTRKSHHVGSRFASCDGAPGDTTHNGARDSQGPEAAISK
jgi:hypothetical protein